MHLLAIDAVPLLKLFLVQDDIAIAVTWLPSAVPAFTGQIVRAWVHSISSPPQIDNPMSISPNSLDDQSIILAHRSANRM